MSWCTLVALPGARAFYDALGLETLSELRLLMKRWDAQRVVSISGRSKYWSIRRGNTLLMSCVS
jgi:hypothetical protein